MRPCRPSSQRSSWVAVLPVLPAATLAAWAVHARGAGVVERLEVAKTVDAFLGHWTMTGTYLEARTGPVASLTSRMDCELTGLGKAVTCHVVTVGSDGSRVELTSIVGYSPDEKLVRLMEISSSGSYHDHRGRWHGDRIEFEPLSYSVSGRRTTEHFSIAIPSAGKMTIQSVEVGAQGKSTTELAGSRVPVTTS
jgi:hypothetical protein